MNSYVVAALLVVLGLVIGETIAEDSMALSLLAGVLMGSGAGWIVGGVLALVVSSFTNRGEQ